MSHEEKFKLLLLGEKELCVILNEIAKSAKQASKKNVNAVLILYPKLLSDIGEEETVKSIKSIKSSESLSIYKKELYQLMKLLPLYDTRLTDFKTISAALANWEMFSLPIIPK